MGFKSKRMQKLGQTWGDRFHLEKDRLSHLIRIIIGDRTGYKLLTWQMTVQY